MKTNDSSALTAELFFFTNFTPHHIIYIRASEDHTILYIRASEDHTILYIRASEDHTILYMRSLARIKKP
ncbi:MAG: hypothetical protein SOZ67_06770 [Alloprevotella sp.]|nr:hypothetical protein [Alloprevotella sp.]